MIRILSCIVLVFSVLTATAQEKDCAKLEALLKAGSYDKCIANAEKLVSKFPSDARFPMYSYLAHYQKYILSPAGPAGEAVLKKAVMAFYSARQKDKNGTMIKETWQSEAEALRRLLFQVGDSLYSQGAKEKSAFYFNYLVKIFNDTTPQYCDINGLAQVVTPGKSVISLQQIVSSDTLNQVDAQGRKQGRWMKLYKNGNLAYNVFFVDNRPVGEYKRFHENGQLQALLMYDSLGQHARAALFDETGRKIAEGNYIGKLKDSIWDYYSYNRNVAEMEAEYLNYSVKKGEVVYLVAKESYRNGVKHGIWTKYLPSGAKTEETTYENDVENGLHRQFFPDGKVKVLITMKNGLRHGPYSLYYPDGDTDTEGVYVSGERHGVWKMYDIKGELIREINYRYGKVLNKEVVDQEETELMEELLKKKENIQDPEKFINNPDVLLNQGGGGGGGWE